MKGVKFGSIWTIAHDISTLLLEHYWSSCVSGSHDDKPIISYYVHDMSANRV